MSYLLPLLGLMPQSSFKAGLDQTKKECENIREALGLGLSEWRDGIKRLNETYTALYERAHKVLDDVPKLRRLFECKSAADEEQAKWTRNKISKMNRELGRVAKRSRLQWEESIRNDKRCEEMQWQVDTNRLDIQWNANSIRDSILEQLGELREELAAQRKEDKMELIMLRDKADSIDMGEKRAIYEKLSAVTRDIELAKEGFVALRHVVGEMRAKMSGKGDDDDGDDEDIDELDFCESEDIESDGSAVDCV